jgi:hypothetical protein
LKVSKKAAIQRVMIKSSHNFDIDGMSQYIKDNISKWYKRSDDLPRLKLLINSFGGLIPTPGHLTFKAVAKQWISSIYGNPAINMRLDPNVSTFNFVDNGGVVDIETFCNNFWKKAKKARDPHVFILYNKIPDRMYLKPDLITKRKGKNLVCFRIVTSLIKRNLVPTVIMNAVTFDAYSPKRPGYVVSACKQICGATPLFAVTIRKVTNRKKKHITFLSPVFQLTLFKTYLNFKMDILRVLYTPDEILPSDYDKFLEVADTFEIVCKRSKKHSGEGKVDDFDDSESSLEGFEFGDFEDSSSRSVASTRISSEDTEELIPEKKQKRYKKKEKSTTEESSSSSSYESALEESAHNTTEEEIVSYDVVELPTESLEDDSFEAKSVGEKSKYDDDGFINNSSVSTVPTESVEEAESEVESF